MIDGREPATPGGPHRRLGASSLPFANRSSAGKELAGRVVAAAPLDPVVLALPRGGVPVALEVARALRCPFDLLLVRKIGAPGQPEVAVAAVVDGEPPRTILNPQAAGRVFSLEAYLRQAEAAAHAEIERRRTRYLAGRRPVPVAGRTAVVVDDGIATGTTTLAAVGAMRARAAARVLIAVPVAARDALDDLEAYADGIICLATPEPFIAVGAYFDDFHQLDDEELAFLLGTVRTDDEAKPASVASLDRGG